MHLVLWHRSLMARCGGGSGCVSMPTCNSAMRARGCVEQLGVELRVELAVLAVAIRKRSSRGRWLSQYQEEPASVCRH